MTGTGPVAPVTPRAMETPRVSSVAPSAPSRSFRDVLGDAIAEVNRLQLEAQASAEALARGELEDMHALTLALERAQLALDLTVAVRNKLIEAYQEISRMQL